MHGTKLVNRVPRAVVSLSLSPHFNDTVSGRVLAARRAQRQMIGTAACPSAERARYLSLIKHLLSVKEAAAALPSLGVGDPAEALELLRGT